MSPLPKNLRLQFDYGSNNLNLLSNFIIISSGSSPLGPQGPNPMGELNKDRCNSSSKLSALTLNKREKRNSNDKTFGAQKEL